MADLVDVGAAVTPLALDVLERLLALLDHSAVVLDLEPAVLADVAEVRRDRLHATPSSSHLDHDLGRPAHGGLDAAADRLGPAAERSQARCSAPDDPVAG